MALKLGSFLISIFHNKYIAVLFVSMFPLIELKGAIPIGMSSAFNMGLIETSLIAYLGSTLVSLILFFLLIPIFNLLKKIKFFKSLVLKIESVLKRKAKEIADKTSGNTEKVAKKIMMVSLLIFVAVPFPVTGVWTGTAIAVFLGLKFRESVIPLALGNLIAGTLITLLTLIFKAHVDYIIYALFIIAICMLVLFIIKIVKAKPETERTINTENNENE